MTTIGSIGSQPPPSIQQTPPPSAKPVGNDGDHDNDAKESHAAQAQETASPQHALNVTA